MGLYWHEEVFFGFTIDIRLLVKGVDALEGFAVGRAVHATLADLSANDEDLAETLYHAESRPTIEIYTSKVCFSYVKADIKGDGPNGRQWALRPRVSASQRANAHKLLGILCPQALPSDPIGLWAMRTCWSTLNPETDVYAHIEELQRLAD